jgi:hypothetical protein
MIVVQICTTRQSLEAGLLRLLRQRALLSGLLGALDEALRERLEPRAQRRERIDLEGQARRGVQAALAGQADVDPRDPAGGLERDGGGRLALDGGVRRQEAACDEGVGAAEAARGRRGAHALPEGLGGGVVAVCGEEHVGGGSPSPWGPAAWSPSRRRAATSRSGASPSRGCC